MLRALGALLGALAIAAAVWFDYHPASSPHLYLLSLGAAGIVLGVFSFLASRSPGSRESEARPRLPAPLDQKTSPPGASSQLPDTLESLPAWAQLQWDLTRALWKVRAAEAEVWGQELAELVMMRRAETSGRDTRDRLTDATLLAEGFRAIAAGRVPDYRPERFRQLMEPVDIEIRLAELEVDERKAVRDARVRDPESSGITPEERLKEARTRFEHLSATESRWVEVYLLKRGYETLLHHLEESEGEAL
jgi:hypothetical protein